MGCDPRTAFFEQGYFLVPNLLRGDEVARLAAAFDRLEELARSVTETSTVRGSLFVMGPATADRAGAEPRPRLDRVVWCGAADPSLAAAGRSPRMLEIAADLLGSDTFDHIISQAHIKSPGDGLAFPWHQDSVHRRYGSDDWRDVNGRGSFVQIIAAVDAMTVDNGALAVVPGSQRLGHLPVDASGVLPAGTFDEREAVAIVAGPGAALVLHPFTIHGSPPNRGRTKRRVFINGFASPGANRRVYPGAGTGVRLSFARSTAA